MTYFCFRFCQLLPSMSPLDTKPSASVKNDKKTYQKQSTEISSSLEKLTIKKEKVAKQTTTTEQKEVKTNVVKSSNLSTFSRS